MAWSSTACIAGAPCALIRSSGSHPAGQDGDAQRLPGLQERQGEVDDPLRCLDAGTVAVERHDRFVRDAPDHPPSSSVTAVPRARLGGGEARFAEGDHIHVAFGDDERLALARRLARGEWLKRLRPLSKSSVSGPFRYLAWTLGSRVRPPRLIGRPRVSLMGKMMRAEAVVKAAVVGLGDEAGGDHQIGWHALGGQRILQRMARGRGPADIRRSTRLRPAPTRFCDR